MRTGAKTTAVMKNIFSCLIFSFWITNKFSFSTLLKILKQKKVKGSASKANKDCQVLLIDVHVHRTPKVSFLRRIIEDDGKQAVSTLHSNVQLLFSLIKAIVLWRCRPHNLKFDSPWTGLYNLSQNSSQQMLALIYRPRKRAWNRIRDLVARTKRS